MPELQQHLMFFLGGRPWASCRVQVRTVHDDTRVHLARHYKVEAMLTAPNRGYVVDQCFLRAAQGVTRCTVLRGGSLPICVHNLAVIRDIARDIAPPIEPRTLLMWQ